MSSIIIIDDSYTIRISVQYALKNKGFNFKLAENGLDALNIVKDLKQRNEAISLCIVDINMPVMDGITFIKEFRKLDRFTPILVLTTESEATKIQEGKDAGASGWIIKPFLPDDLIRVVDKFLK